MPLLIDTMRDLMSEDEGKERDNSKTFPTYE